MLQHRARYREGRGVDSPVLSVAGTGPHQGCTPARHDGLHVGEVEVDQTRHEDQIGDAPHRLVQYFIHYLEGLCNRCVAVDGHQQPVVRNGDYRIGRAAQLRNPLPGAAGPDTTLEGERQRHDGDRQSAQFRRKRRDDRCGSRARASAQTGGHKHDVGPRQRGEQLLRVLKRGPLADLRVRAGTQSVCQLGANLQLDRRRILRQRLQVGVGDHEVDTATAKIPRHHAVHGVAAPTSDTDHLHPRPGRRGVLQGDPELALRPILWSIHEKYSLKKPRSRPATRRRPPDACS